MIPARAGDEEWALISSPRGWVNKLIEAFKTQLKSGGVFINADLGVYETGEHSNLPFYTCGKAAIQKCEDFRLTEAMLSRAGLQVEVLILDVFVSRVFPEWRDYACKSERDDMLSENHYVLMARRS